MDKQSLLDFISKKYPRISGLIEAAWKEPDFDDMLNKLLLDSRDGTRQGFPMDVTEAVFELIRIRDSEKGATGWQNASRTKYHDGDR